VAPPPYTLRYDQRSKIYNPLHRDKKSLLISDEDQGRTSKERRVRERRKGEKFFTIKKRYLPPVRRSSPPRPLPDLHILWHEV